jgi:nucleoside-diphosphate-sugar epimerase
MAIDGTILMTGGTGTLGRELVRRLAAELTGPRIVVLSRSALDPCPGFPPGVQIVRGDLLAGPTLGLPTRVREELSKSVTHVLHCAAETRFTLPLEESRAVNVGGTRSLLDFARSCPTLRQIGCFSTVYVAGRRTGPITEDDLGDDGAGSVNSYEQSKNEMERELRARMPDLPIAVYRLSTLIGDSSTGLVTGLNAFHHALRLLYHGLAPMMPGDPAHRIDVVAVDYVADAACWLFDRRFEAGRTYHLCSGPERSASLAELIDLPPLPAGVASARDRTARDRRPPHIRALRPVCGRDWKRGPPTGDPGGPELCLPARVSQDVRSKRDRERSRGQRTVPCPGPRLSAERGAHLS